MEMAKGSQYCHIVAIIVYATVKKTGGRGVMHTELPMVVGYDCFQ